MKSAERPHCYQSYYRLWVAPIADGSAMVFTCCLNRFMPENNLIIKKNILIARYNFNIALIVIHFIINLTNAKIFDTKTSLLSSIFYHF